MLPIKLGLLFLFLSLFCPTFSTSDDKLSTDGEEEDSLFTKNWAIEIEGGNEVANRIASSHGFVNMGQVGSLDGHYHFVHLDSPSRSKRSIDHLHTSLMEEEEVLYVEQQRLLKRRKRDYVFPADPMWSKQWYMHRSNKDMNIKPVWELGITGKGSVISILDDGIENTHPDLKDNYDPQASYDFNSHDSDPFPRYDYSNENKHGTRCAGEVAAAKNDVCSIGMAYHSSIGGVRMLDGDVTDTIEAGSLSLNPQHIDIYSSSWGPDDDGKTVDGPGKLTKKAFLDGVTKGRNGLGSLYVWASGNGGSNGDSCNCDGYAVSPYTLSISSVTENENFPWYAEKCSSNLACTYSSGSNGEQQVISTDLHHKCTNRHTGTSASAPMAAGLLALVLEANRNLTWRDVQYIIVYSSNPKIPRDSDWAKNGAGLSFSHKYGFGLMDASALVNRAKHWKNVPNRQSCTVNFTITNGEISQGTPVELSVGVSKVNDCPNISYLEHVQVYISISVHKGGRGRLSISLQSPHNTKSILLPYRKRDLSNKNLNNWPFMTVFSWGEDPVGNWVLKINSKGAKATLEKAQLVLHGVSTRPRVIRDIPEECSYQCKGGCAKQGPQYCDTCKLYRVLTTLECVDRCPDGTYLDQTTCRPCVDNCASCTNSSVCLQCTPGSLKISSGVCLRSCPTSTYIAFENNTCYECHSSCMSCVGPSPNNCTECLSVQYFLTEGACVLTTNCTPSKYFDTRAFECRPCDESCAECNGHESSHCTACYPGRVLTDGQCVPNSDSCHKGEYFNEQTTSCAICPPGCSKCVDAINCIDCHSGYFLHTTRIGTTEERKKLCVKTCPVGYYSEPKEKVCMGCAPFCKTCNASDFCLTCAKQGASSLHGMCPQPCKDNQFYDSAIGECRLCSGHCESCVGEKKCTKCTDGLFLSVDGTCVKSCPPLTVSNFVNHICESTECHESCLTCSGPEPDQCLSCANNRVFNAIDRVCLDSCPNRKVLVDDSCIDCDAGCLTCAGVTDSECLSCDDDLLLDDHSCVSTCRGGTYIKDGLCLSCPSGCVECINSIHCKQCHTGYFLHPVSNKCLTNCPKGFYEVGQTCAPCIVKGNCSMESPSDQSPHNVGSNHIVNTPLIAFVSIVMSLIIVLIIIVTIWQRQHILKFCPNRKVNYKVLYSVPDHLVVNGTTDLDELVETDETDSETEVFTNYQ